MLAGTGLTTAATALTSILYSGQWTMKSGQQYLRARFYDPASGTFNRLDPFAGNLADPQSLHKYLYAHGNPVAFSDPSGNFVEPLLLAGQSGGTTSWVRVMTSGLIGAAFAHGDAFLRTMYMTGDLDAATDAARAAAAAGFAMGLAVGMLEGRFTPYIGMAAFSFGVAQAKQAWKAGYEGLAVLDFTLAIFSFFTGVYKPLTTSVRLPVVSNRPVLIKESKWDYFFGRVKSNKHNEVRSLQNAKDLETLGFTDTPTGREGLTRLFEIGRHLPATATHTTPYGVTITRRVPAGNGGVIDVKYYYPGGDMNAIPEIATIIPKVF